jgi:putative aldouronate transport system substrate-binding protein
MAYGDVGPVNMGGRIQDPDFKIVPVVTPSSQPGQITKLGQNNSNVRSARAVVTDRAVDEGIEETVIRWMDYWYSQDGGDLASYGIEGHSYEWGDDGNFHFIHPMLQTPDADFWSIYHVFKMHEWAYLRDSTSYEMEPEVWECIDLWGAQDLSWVFPDNIAFTPDESSEIARIMTDIDTHTLEQSLAFITGTRSISEFDTFVTELDSMGLSSAVEIRQAALTRYLNR